MERIRIRVANTGAVWVMAQCSICSRVSEHAMADATERLIPCPKCGHRMDIRNATIDAVEKTDVKPAAGRVSPRKRTSEPRVD